MRKRMLIQEFINKANIVHNYKYDYSNTIYTIARNKINIICPYHGMFTQRPYDHLNGSGCPKCVGLNNKTNDEFIKESKNLFGNKFEYDNTNYVSSQHYVIITCKLHGDFKVTPNNHLSKKQGCSICKESKGEEKISEILNKMNISFIREKKFNNCKGKRRKLPFDFYLPIKNLIIEYDGKHHFEMVNAFGGEKGFKEIQKDDKIKNEFLKKNEIDILRIPYYQYNNIDVILNAKVG
jgi:very-short-patch-repair endonuclease